MLNRFKRAAGDEVSVMEIDGVRSLHLGNDTVQSAMRVREPNKLELTYTRAMLCFLLFKPQAKNVLMIGLGAGSLPKYMHAYCLNLNSTVLEINPAVIHIAYHQFYLPPNDARLNVICADGLAYLREQKENHDVVLIDAFDSHGIPPHFGTQAFFDDCHENLNLNGVMVMNLWGSDKHFDVYLQRIEQSFAHRVWVLPTGKPGNIAVFAFKRAPSELRLSVLREHAKQLETQHAIEFLQFLEKIAEHNHATPHRLVLGEGD